MTETRALTTILVFNIPTVVHPFESIFVQGERKRLILSDCLDDNVLCVFMPTSIEGLVRKLCAG